jgi:RNase P/RNase MRP subunit p29
MRKRHGIEGEPEVVNVTRNTMKKEIRQRVKKVLINKGVEHKPGAAQSP